MSNLIGIVTYSGFGKSTSIGKNEEIGIEGLNPKETVLFNVKGKSLPFRGWKKQYNGKISEGGNYAEIADSKTVNEIIGFIGEKRTDIHNVVIDDFQYLLAEQYMADALKSGFEKFSKLGKNIYDLLTTCGKLRSDINVFILTHSEEVKHGGQETYKIKTIGEQSCLYSLN
jgi:hypothetical protein